MLKERGWLLAMSSLAYLASAEILSWWLSKVPPCVIESQYQRASYQPGQNACATLSEGIFRLIKFLWLSTGHDEILGFGTLLIALFTWTLWRSTRRLWIVTRDTLSHASETAQSQLRAYISVDDGVVFWGRNGPNTMTCIATIKNYGQTPAYDLICWIKFSVRNTGLPFAETGTFGSKSIVGPGAVVNVTTHITDMPEHLLSAIEHKTATIYAWGRVEYVTFKKDRFFEFRCAMNGPLEHVNFRGNPGQGWGLAPHPLGYEAD